MINQSVGLQTLRQTSHIPCTSGLGETAVLSSVVVFSELLLDYLYLIAVNDLNDLTDHHHHHSNSNNDNNNNNNDDDDDGYDDDTTTATDHDHDLDHDDNSDIESCNSKHVAIHSKHCKLSPTCMLTLTMEQCMSESLTIHCGVKGQHSYQFWQRRNCIYFSLFFAWNHQLVMEGRKSEHLEKTQVTSSRNCYILKLESSRIWSWNLLSNCGGRLTKQPCWTADWQVDLQSKCAKTEVS